MIVSSTQKKNPNKTKAKKTHPQPTVWILQRQRKVLMLPFFFHFQQHTLWREIFAPLLLGQKLTPTITSVLALNLKEIVLPWILPLLHHSQLLYFFPTTPFPTNSLPALRCSVYMGTQGEEMGEKPPIPGEKFPHQGHSWHRKPHSFSAPLNYPEEPNAV